MDKYTFADILVEELSRKLGGRYQVGLADIQRNNGGTEEGFTLREKDSAVSSIYSLEGCYRYFQSEWDMEKVIRGILREYTTNRNSLSVPTTKELMEYDKMKDRLYLRLINREWNHDYLEDRLSFPILDLAAVCCIDIRYPGVSRMDNPVQAGLSVLKEQVQQWKVPPDTVFMQALYNMKQKGCYQLLRLTDLLSSFGAEYPEEEQDGLWVFQDSSGRYSGTTAILYPELLEQAARTFGEGFYILPSSIYEVLLLPEGKGIPPEELKEIVAEVNERTGKKEEALSDVIYHYDKVSKRLCTARS